MFTVYIEYNKLLEFCRKHDEADPWYAILSKQVNININHSIDDEDFTDENNPVFIFSQMFDVGINDATSYMEEIITDHQKVLMHPCGAYLLNINAEDAKEIQEKYGVLCQSANELSAKPLTFGDFSLTTTGKGPWSWHQRLPVGSLIPSNSLIIVDRYLFASEKGDTLQDSYDNIVDIMEAFMPNKFDSSFHLFIIFDMYSVLDKDIQSILNSPKDRNFTDEERQQAFAKITTQLNKIKSSFVNNHHYPVILEVLSCDKRDKSVYGSTHDRKIISNYFFVTSTHKFKAFRNGRPIVKQKIDLLTLYSKGITDSLSTVPEEAHASDINDFRNVLNEAKNHPTLYAFSQNGNAKTPINKAENRILS